MNFIHSNGEPFDLDSILNEFWGRIDTLDTIAQVFTAGKRVNAATRALASAIMHLRDDYDEFERAIRDWHLRENPEAYRDEADAAKAGAQ